MASSFRFLVSFSITDTHTHTYVPVAIEVPWKITFNDSSHKSLFIPLHHLPVITGETASDSRVRLNRSVLRCNLNAAFLGSPLSVSPLLPWLPVKSLLCLFVAKLCVFLFLPQGVFVCNDAGKCRHLSQQTLTHLSWSHSRETWPVNDPAHICTFNTALTPCVLFTRDVWSLCV